ncbi:MAG TPA: hypothetical protein VHP58_04995 [Alphaproteobacteria bacterium]|nr:hypothetical protein [Alphaproteobacteria bacterium]
MTRPLALLMLCLLPAIAGAQVDGGPYVSGTLVYAGGVSLKPANRQSFTGSGTWTKPSGYSTSAMAYIQCWGGGASGGRGTTMSFASGGGGGGYSERWVLLSSLGSTETVTIGAGGAAKTSQGAGNAGGNTTFGSWLTAYGGSPGGDVQSSNPPPFGGSPMSQAAKQTSRIDSGGTYYYCGAVGPYEGGSGIGSPCAAPEASMANSIYGGGGGGQATTTAALRAGGSSTNGGAGGAGGSGSGVAGTAGTQPAGGGGGAVNANSGAGAAGQCNVMVFN